MRPEASKIELPVTSTSPPMRGPDMVNVEPSTPSSPRSPVASPVNSTPSPRSVRDEPAADVSVEAISRSSAEPAAASMTASEVPSTVTGSAASKTGSTSSESVDDAPGATVPKSSPPAPMPSAFARTTVPSSMVSVPEYALAPDRRRVPAPRFTTLASPNCAGATSDVVPALRSNTPPARSTEPAMSKVTAARERMSASTTPSVPPNCAWSKSASTTTMSWKRP